MKKFKKAGISAIISILALLMVSTNVSAVMLPSSNVSTFNSDVEQTKAQIDSITPITENNNTKYYDENGSEINLNDITNNVAVTTSLPEAYDLRNYNRTTPIRNQGSEGLCWDFAATASIESSILSQPNLADKLSNPLNLSEGGNAYYLHTNFSDINSPFYGDYINDIKKGAGGATASVIATGIASGYGAYQESDLPYSQWTDRYSENLRFYSDYRLKDYSTLSNSADVIKDKIISNGAVTVDYSCYQSNYYSLENTQSYYDNGSPITYNPNNQGHVVAIIGWDDNYSKDNFKPQMQPENNGAWLCKNSWGDDWGTMSGYFWMSYDTSNLSFGQFIMQSTDAYDNIYQHQITATSSLKLKSAANIFTANSNETLKQIGFGVTGSSDYNISVYKLNENFTTPTDGELLTTFDGKVEFTGYHSIICPNNVELKKGDTFSVIVSNEDSIFIPFRNSNSGDIQPNKCMISNYKDKWADIADKEAMRQTLNSNSSYGYAEIKAYTSNNVVDKSKLSELIQEVTDYKIDERTDKTLVNKLNDVLSSAKDILNSDSIIQNKIDNAYYLLKDAFTNVSQNVYYINSVSDYINLSNITNQDYVSNIDYIILNTDLDLSSYPQSCSLFSHKIFMGEFIGNNHTIKNVHYTTGLFYETLLAKINNVNFENITSSNDDSAGVIAEKISSTTIENCNISNATVSSEQNLSGLISGTAFDSTLINCTITNSKVANSSSAGILFGRDDNNTTTNVTTTNYTICATNTITDNKKFTFNVTNIESTKAFFKPWITLTDSTCTLESFCGTISSVTPFDTTITKDGELYNVDITDQYATTNVTYLEEYPQNYNFTANHDTMSVTINSYQPDDTSDFALSIPDSFGGLPVSEIKGDFLSLNTKEKLTSITIPSSAKEIKDSTFSGCYKLANVKLNEGLETIGKEAFQYCSAIQNLTLPESVTTIDDYAFMGCYFLVTTLGKNINTIGKEAFGYLSQVGYQGKNVSIPDFVLNGYSDTITEKYANNNGFKFVNLNTEEPYSTDKHFDYSTILKGDVTKDGIINIQDVTAVQQWLAGQLTLDSVQLYNALVETGDYSITIKNSTTIQQYLARIIDSLDGGGQG